MFDSETPGTAFFEGLNDINFLNRYSRMCTDYQINEQEKIKIISCYYEIFTEKYIETLISSCETSRAAFQKIPREEYKDQDFKQ